MKSNIFKIIIGVMIAQLAFAAPPSIPSFQTSKINVDTLDNKAGGGQPKFSNGFDLNEISSPSAPSASTLRLYGKSDDNLYFQNSSGTESQVGSGSGQKNYVQTGSNTAAGWTASGAGITVTTDTTAADLPRANTTKTGIKFTGVSGSTAFGYYDFKLDPSDYNTKIQVQFAVACGLAGGATSTCAAADFRVDLYSCTIAWSSGTCGGTSTRLSLSTDASSVSALPANTGVYRSTVDAPGSSAAFMQLQIGLNATQTHTLVASDVIAGPGVQIQGAAVTQWMSYTPTYTGLGTVTNNSAFYRRVGDAVEVQASVTAGTTAASLASITLPNGYNVNSSALSLSNTTSNPGNVVGSYSPPGTTGLGYMVTAPGTSTSVVYFGGLSSGSATATPANGSTLFTSSNQVIVKFVVAANELAGSGTLNVVSNDCEYAYNTDVSATGTVSASGFANGPNGQTFPSTNWSTGTRWKRAVRFLTPIQPTDVITEEFLDSPTGQWSPNSDNFVIGKISLNANNFGAWITQNTNAVTDAFISFGEGGRFPGATYGATGAAWTDIGGVGGVKWRVKKCSAGQAVGFGVVSQNSAGLVPSTNSNLDDSSATRLGLKVYAHGTTYNGGNAPTIILSAGGGSLSSINYSSFMPYQDNTGSWHLRISFDASVSSTSRTNASFAINGITFANIPTTVIGQSISAANDVPTANSAHCNTNTNTVQAQHTSGTTAEYSFGGDCLLTGKPSWAY